MTREGKLDSAAQAFREHCLRIEFSSVSKIIEVTDAPVLNRVPASLQVIIEKVPEGCPSELVDVKGVIYDDIKSIRGGFYQRLRIESAYLSGCLGRLRYARRERNRMATQDRSQQWSLEGNSRATIRESVPGTMVHIQIAQPDLVRAVRVRI